MKRVLVLGSGRIARPCVTYLQKQDWIHVVVVDASSENLARVAGGHSRTTTQVCDISRDTQGIVASSKADLVINLLPPEFRERISADCLKAGVHLVHPCYSDEGANSMTGRVKDAGLTFLYELGVDPGIDHMSAARTIDKVRSEKGQVLSFRSICGAIPAAEANTNPWGFKLSWAPESLIGASRRSARVMLNGDIKDWPDGKTFEHVSLEEVEGLGWFEVYANADSVPYLRTYGIPEATSIYRGTIRYLGWCETIVAMNKLGLFAQAKEDLKGLSFRGFLARKCGSDNPGRAEQLVCEKLRIETASALFLRLRWLGFFDDRLIPGECGSSRDIVRFLFGEKLVFQPQERDLIILKDEIIASYPSTRKCLRHTSTLIDFGIPGGDSSIARTTGIPPAIAARFILEGIIHSKGILLPTLAEVYNPVLAELEKEGIVLTETSREV